MNTVLYPLRYCIAYSFDLRFLLIFCGVLCLNTLNSQIIIQPENPTSCEGDSITLSVSPTGDSTLFQWQDSTDVGWVNIEDDSFYSGSTSPALKIVNVPFAFHLRGFRCRVDF